MDDEDNDDTGAPTPEEFEAEVNRQTRALALRMLVLLESGQPTGGTSWVLPRGSRAEVERIINEARVETKP